MRPTRFIFLCWALFFAFWLVLAVRDRSRPVRQEAPLSRLAYLVLIGAAAGLLTFDFPVLGPLLTRFLPEGIWPGLLGVSLVWLGMALAIWARMLLGRSWSARISVQEQQFLVRRGPYAVVRHPIYAGALLAILGTALAMAEVRGLIALGLAVGGLGLKIRFEETILREQFGEEYQRYAREVKALIPFLL